mgnify:FL=1|jgi:hypothetical protein
MPKGGDWFNLVYVTVAYLALALGLMLFIEIDNIRANWPKYRCNPMYMPLSKNVQEDFTYCVQNMQANYMGVLLKPITWIIKNLGSMASDVFGSLQKFRKMISFIRDFIASVVGAIMGIFANISIQMQKLTVSIKDSVGKMVGVLVTLLYTMDGSVKTMQSAWAGPPGQMVRAICFRNDTPIKLENGDIMPMNKVSLGDKLSNGQSVYAVLKVANANDECFYRMKSPYDDQTVYVTGSHYIFNEQTKRYCMIKDHPDAVLTTEKDDTFSCLITDGHTIPIAGMTFWDWEDDLVPK